MDEPVDASGPTIAWRECGTGASTPILLLHGLGGSRISWEPQLTGLSGDRRVVAWDLPGYGESAHLDGPVTFDALADAVARCVSEIGAVAVHLVGISFGGMIAQYTAARHPALVRSLTLLATSPKFGLDGTRPEEWRAARLAPLDAGVRPADMADRVLSALAGPDITPEAFAGQRAAMARITADALRRSIDCLVTHDSREALADVSCPTQCLVGDLDAETPVAYSEAIVERVAGARLHVIPGAGHLLNVEAPDAVNTLIAAHVGRAEKETPT